MIDLIALDPATATLIETIVVTGFLICSSATALLMLPWTDAEIDEVDTAARSLAGSLARSLPRSLPRQLVAPNRAATRTVS